LGVSEQGKVEVRFVEQTQRQLRLMGVEPGWDLASLTNWLDRKIPHPDITRTQATLFIHRALTALMESRNLTLDQLACVRRWLRNLERRPDGAFWLQTATDKFYPDFLAELDDGRILVVEYKGHDRWSNDDSKEKRALGELWESRSNGRCLFIMPDGPDWTAITGRIA
jgi:hypothetical protein